MKIQTFFREIQVSSDYKNVALLDFIICIVAFVSVSYGLILIRLLVEPELNTWGPMFESGSGRLYFFLSPLQEIHHFAYADNFQFKTYYL